MSGQIKLVIGILLGTGLLIAGFVFFGSKSIPTKLGSKTDGPAQVQRDYHPAVGDEAGDKTVTVVEFADLQCPACATVAPTMQDLAKEPNVRLVFRHFPLDQHLNAEVAAKAAEAANAQGKFWELYYLLYERQADWSSLSTADAEARMESYAQELGLDVERFKKDRANEALLDHIRLDKGEGLALGVSGTPTVFINGKKFEGALTLDGLKAAVAEATKQ